MESGQAGNSVGSVSGLKITFKESTPDMDDALKDTNFGDEFEGGNVSRVASLRNRNVNSNSIINTSIDTAVNNSIINNHNGNTILDSSPEAHQEMTHRSKTIIHKMDKNKDGIVTLQDAANFGKKQEKKISKLKYLLALSVLLLIIILGIIFGLFILGFELTKTTDINTIGEYTHPMVSSLDGKYISTLPGMRYVKEIHEWWEKDPSELHKSDMIVNFIHGWWDGQYIYVSIAYFKKYDNPIKYIEFYDPSGYIKIERYYNDSQSPIKGSRLVMYETLRNGTQIMRGWGYGNTDTSSTSNGTRRVLQSWENEMDWIAFG